MASLMERAQTAADRYKIDPWTQDFDESKGVAGRVNQIASSGSPLMQLAETRGNQLAAQRGLTGSSLGVEAAQKAVLEAATPIATADANLFNSQALTNQNARNVASQSNQASGTTLSNTALQGEVTGEQQDKSLMESARQFNAAQGQQASQFAAGQALTREMFSSDEAFRQAQLAQQSSQFGVTSGQTQQQIEAQKAQFGITAGMTAQQIANQVQQFGQQMGMSQQQIDAQKAQFAVSSGQTQQQIDAQKAQFAQSLGLSVQELNLKQQQIGQAQQQIENQKAQFAQQLGMSVQDLALRRDSLDANQQQFLKQLEQQQAQLGEQARQFNTSQASNKEMFQQELGQKASQFGQTMEQQRMLATMDVTSREKIAAMDAQYKTDIQGSVNISNAWGTMMQSIGNIQNNPNLEPGAKQTLVENTLGAFQSFAAFWKKTSNVDIGPLLNFNVVGAGPSSATPNNQSIAPIQPDYYSQVGGGSGMGMGNGGASGTGAAGSVGSIGGGFGGAGSGFGGSSDGGFGGEGGW